jgi:urease accessory protein
MRWRVWQLVDSAFPTGGFAHSGGLEAAVQLGELVSVEDFVRQAAWQAGYGALPLVGAAWDEPERELDGVAEAFLTSVPARQASVRQGKAFAGVCARSFGVEVAHTHLAVVMGAACRRMDVAREDAQAVYLHGVVRGILAAAVRLGKLGPFEAQRLQSTLSPLLDEVLAACAPLGLDELAQTAPVIDLVGAQQDRLYSRMFQS